MKKDGRERVVITHISPLVEGGEFPIKRVIGDEVVISADIFADGHTEIAAELLHCFMLSNNSDRDWQEQSMEAVGNDRWTARFIVEEVGIYEYQLRGWINHFGTWQKDLIKKYQAGLDISIDLLIGIHWIEETLQNEVDLELQEYFLSLSMEKNSQKAYELAIDSRLLSLMWGRFPNKQFVSQSRCFQVIVDRKKAQFSAWYEIFPRSCGEQGNHGTLKECEDFLPTIAEMGFDVVYLPPIHPIGYSNRKGKNNHPKATKGEPGSPWAIGSIEGGHCSIHPNLGTLEEFDHFVKKAEKLGLEVALDIAFQCSPDHPYLKEHPNWFIWRPDGTVMYAENPPKKYEDIVPFNFETEDWLGLWHELREVVQFWMDRGIRIFRVDNPHTKPFGFWQWLISSSKAKNPHLIFLSEAFTRPKVMARLAQLGFTQSYTYFTWRRTKKEIISYLQELTNSEYREFFRPNFWPNTPDILSEELQQDGKATFLTRYFLAATLSSNYGIYGPAYELMIKEGLPGTEEYVDAEKYEIKTWDQQADSIRDFIRLINKIRKENVCLHETNNIRFYEIDNEQILYYGKISSGNALLFFANLDPYTKQSAIFKMPLEDLHIPLDQSYRMHELLSNRRYVWEGKEHEITLDPKQNPVALFKVEKRIKRENDFDYF